MLESATQTNSDIIIIVIVIIVLGLLLHLFVTLFGLALGNHLDIFNKSLVFFFIFLLLLSILNLLFDRLY